MTKSQTAAADIAALLRARISPLVIVTREEARVERYLIEACGAAGYAPRTWDCAAGVRAMNGARINTGSSDPGETLDAIRSQAEGGTERIAWIMRDLHQWWGGAIGILTSRQLRNLARSLPATPRDRAQALIILTPAGDIPPELQGDVTVVDWPLPDRDEVASILDSAINGLPEDMRASAAPNGQRDSAIDAAVGLSGKEAADCYARSIVQSRRVDPILVANEKKRVIAKAGVLEWIDPLAGGLDAVGGLDVLKAWLIARRAAYTAKARAYGLPAPKGCLLVGIPGCGKSLSAKAVATAWGVPLLRMDLGALKSKFVGESEQNLRRAFRTIESVGRCVLWIDELEKALAGATQGAADGGVSADALGALLSWMQDRAGECFVIATANDVTQLPPELLRKGRWDEVWAIDLPNINERQPIMTAALRAHGRESITINPALLEGFSGAEIAALVPEAMFAAFADNERAITAQDLHNAARNVTPLSKTAPEKIERLKAWVQGRARLATTPAKEGGEQGRTLDLD